MATRFVMPKADVGSGIVPPDGAKLFFTITGTDTDLDTFSDEALTTAHANPVIADSAGIFPEIFFGSSSIYRVRLRNKNDVQTGFGVVDGVTASAILSELDTIDLMTAVSAPTDGDKFRVHGYTALGDNQVRDYRWDSSSTTTANGGTVFAHDTITPGRFLAEFNDITFIDFGAVDGGPNETTSILNALTAGIDVIGSPGTFLVDGGILIITDNISVHWQGTILKRLSLGIANDILLSVTGTTGVSFSGNLELDGNKAAFSPTSTDRERDGLEIRSSFGFKNNGFIFSHDNVGHGFLGAICDHCDWGNIHGKDNGANTGTGFQDDGFAGTRLKFCTADNMLMEGSTRYGFSVTGGRTNSHNNEFTNVETKNNGEAGLDFEFVGSCSLENFQLGNSVDGWERFLCTDSIGVRAVNGACSLIFGGSVASPTDNIYFENIDINPATGAANIALVGDNPTLINVRCNNTGLDFSAGKTVFIDCQDGRGRMENVWCDRSRIYEVINVREVTQCGADDFEAGTLYEIGGISIANVAGDRLIEVKHGVIQSGTKINANSTTVQSIVTGTFTTVGWTKSLDIWDEFISDVFTAKSAGNYLITARVQLLALPIGAKARLAIASNSGATLEAISTSESTILRDEVPINVNAFVVLAAGDNIEIQLWQNSGGNLSKSTASTENNLSIIKISDFG